MHASRFLSALENYFVSPFAWHIRKIYFISNILWEKKTEPLHKYERGHTQDRAV